MKIRIKGNTLRLRLTKSEVAALASDGKVEERTPFPAHSALVYSLQTQAGSSKLASFTDNKISVFVGDVWAQAWSQNDEVGVEFAVAAGENTLHVLIEKDFNCLTPREDEDQEDHFTNPQTSHQKC